MELGRAGRKSFHKVTPCTISLPLVARHKKTDSTKTCKTSMYAIRRTTRPPVVRYILANSTAMRQAAFSVWSGPSISTRRNRRLASELVSY